MSDNYEIQWAKSQFSYTSIEEISFLPCWFNLFKLVNHHATAYLKVVPVHRADALAMTSLIAQVMPLNTPHVIDFKYDIAAILFEDYGRKRLHAYQDRQQLASLLSTYASLQSNAMQEQTLLNALPVVDSDGLLQNFIEFLNPNSILYKIQENVVSASHFIGREKAALYTQLLGQRLPYLQTYLAKSNMLPFTLNHGDLCTEKAAFKEDEIIIFDWDEASNGPAGMSLHGIFQGCSAVFKLAHGQSAYSNRADNEKYSALLACYIEQLATQHYAQADVLWEAIPAATALGVIHHLLDFAEHTLADTAYQQHIEHKLVQELDDLLALADLLYLQSGQAPLPYIQDYQQQGFLTGVEHTLNTYLYYVPDDHDVQLYLAQFHRDHQLPTNSQHHQASLSTQGRGVIK